MFCPLFTAWEDVFQFLVLSVSRTASPLPPRPTTLDEGVLSSNHWGRDCWGAGLTRMDNAAATLTMLERVSASCGYTSAPLSCRESEVGWTAAPETRMWHMCAWGAPLDPTTSASTLTKREQARQPAAPGLDPPHGLPNQFLEKHWVRFPAFTNCPLIAGWRKGWTLNGILSMGLRASDSCPTLPSRSLKETHKTTPPGTFHAGEILSSSKDCLVSDFTTGRAQGCAVSRSVPGRKVFALSFIIRSWPKFTTKQPLFCPVQMSSLVLWMVCIPFHSPFPHWQLSEKGGWRGKSMLVTLT